MQKNQKRSLTRRELKAKLAFIKAWYRQQELRERSKKQKRSKEEEAEEGQSEPPSTQIAA